MYKNANSCVVNMGEKSSFFDCNIGVRQGENLSPVLFAIYLNDFGKFISEYYDGLSNLSEAMREHLSNDDVEIYLKLFTLLYADDTVVLAENETGSQGFKWCQRVLRHLAHDCEYK